MNKSRKVSIVMVLLIFIVGSSAVFADSGIATLREIQSSFRSVAENVLPVVVEVNTVDIIEQNFTINRFPFSLTPRRNNDDESEGQTQEFRRQGLGSGVIVSRKGNKVYILTNNHVIDGADEISVSLYDGRKFDAEIVGSDDKRDIAVIEFSTSEEVPIANLGDSDAMYVGDWVLAIGNPLGFESTVTHGIVSAKGRDASEVFGIGTYTDFIQTDASINSGNSGGALINLDGEVIGINTWIASQTGGSIGIGFAIPINSAKKAIDDLINTGSVQYGWLGINTGDPSDSIREELGLEGEEGSFVYDVFIDSPADDGGIQAGDFITRINNVDIKNSTDLVRVISDLNPGTRYKFYIIREGRDKNVFVTIGTRNSDETEALIWPGMSLIPVNADMRDELDISSREGSIMIAQVVGGSAAEVAGFRQGDIINQINGKKVKSLEEFYDVINGDDDEYMFRLYRRSQPILLGLIKERD